MTTFDRSAPLTDDERAWLHARAAALGLAPEQVHATPFAATEGRMVLSTDPGASLIPVHLTDRGAVFLAETAHVAEGETLAITCPRGDPVRVVLGRLTVEGGARVVAHTHLTLEAATVVAAGPVELVGKDGKQGDPGKPGQKGDINARKAGDDGGRGGDGIAGTDGPGGTLWFGEVSGTLTVVAGGGSGGDAGAGGDGGRGVDVGGNDRGGRGGAGGPGGRGGDAGNGGTVLITYGRLADGAEIHPLMRQGLPGRAGAPGARGDGGSPTFMHGACGSLGAYGNPGTPPDFVIRCVPDVPKP